jgi:hypothetical protein
MHDPYNKLTQQWNRAQRQWAVQDNKTCTATTYKGTRCTRQVGRYVAVPPDFDPNKKELRCFQHA